MKTRGLIQKMSKTKSISKQFQEVIEKHEKELRENYKKMLVRFNQLKKEFQLKIKNN